MTGRPLITYRTRRREHVTETMQADRDERRDCYLTMTCLGRRTQATIGIEAPRDRNTQHLSVARHPRARPALYS